MKRILPFSKKDFKKLSEKKLDINNLAQKFLRQNEALPLYIRQKSIFVNYTLFRRINISKLNYVCIFTGKTRSVNINYKVSNLVFKILMKRGLFSGFKM